MTSPRFAEICVIGPDAQAFLHSQLASDVRAVEPGNWLFGSYCAADGRVQALMMVACDSPECWRLLMPADVASAVDARLQRYRVRARCTIATTGVSIEEGGREEAASASYRCEQFSWRVEAGGSGVSMALAPALWVQQIELGIPWLVAATSERFLPQMLALERLQAYSLRKGCFPGQEIVARTHYLGRSKRRLARLSTLEGDCSLEAGSELSAIEEDHPLGVLIAAASGYRNALAVLPESAVPGMVLRVAGTARNATLVIESDMIETFGDAGLNGRYYPPSGAWRSTG